MKRNLFIALVAMLMVCVMLVCCVSCGKSNNDTNNNVQQSTTNTENENNPGSENSDQQGNVNDANNDNSTSDNSGSNVDNSGNDNNGTDNEGGNNSSDNGGNGTVDDGFVADPNASTVVGFGIYVYDANSASPYSAGQVIKGTLTTLEDGRQIYTFGNFESMYLVGPIQEGRYKTWDLDVVYSDNLVYWDELLDERNDGTFFAVMNAYYVNTSGKDLVYCTGDVYLQNDEYYLIVNDGSNTFRIGEAESNKNITVRVNDVDVLISTYISLDTEMFDGIHDEFTFDFCNSAGSVMYSETYSANNLPDFLTWETEIDRVVVYRKYNGDVKFKTTITRATVLNVNDGLNVDTVINNVGYCHKIAWIIEN